VIEDVKAMQPGPCGEEEIQIKKVKPVFAELICDKFVYISAEL
jgi:hypothetical protein